MDAAPIALGAALLIVALCLPTVRFSAFASKPEVYSIYGGIRALWDDGNPILASIVFAFSVIFPALKLIALAAIWWRDAGPSTAQLDRAVVRRLRLLGKWSMLDVLIIALFVGSIRLGIATAESRAGIHVFTAAILTSMFATARMARRIGAVEAPRPGPIAVPAARGVGRALNLAAAAALAVALSSVLLVVKKAIVFTNDVGFWSTGRELFEGHERTLALGLGLLVVASSVLRTLFATWLWWAPRPRDGVRRLALFLEEWAMIDVFALAIAIVQVKLDQLTTTTLEVGFWATVVAAVLAIADGWWLRRQI